MSKKLYFKMREEEVAHLLTEVENGNCDALTTYANLKQCKNLYEEASKQIESLALYEAEMWSEKTFTESGFVFEKRNGTTRYSFNHIPKYIELKKQLKEVEDQSKQAYLSQQKGLLIADKYGEDIIVPKVSYTKSSLVVKNATQEH